MPKGTGPTLPKESVEKFIPELFDSQALRTPDALAVISSTGSLTYQQLASEAARLSAVLADSGASAEDIVAIYLDRSCPLVSAILGVMKAGAAFTILDVDCPRERLELIIRDTRSRHLITSTRLSASSDLFGCRILNVDCVPTQQSGPEIRSRVQCNSLAYVLYTSGSTGRPKGVMIDHGSIAQHARYTAKRYGLEPNDRAVQFAPPAFDAALEQIFSALISGATLVLRDPELWSPQEFLNRMRTLGINVINPPPSYWRSVIRELSRSTFLGDPHELKVVIIGGEALLPEDVIAARKSPFSIKTMIHCYGPTEATVYVTNTEVPPEIEGTAWEHSIPIGRPIDQRRVYLLDEYGIPVPSGTAGEICIGGAGLARGYLNMPSETAERFLPDPYSPYPGTRLYRTGDLGRMSEDGNIEFLGRLDNQIKIRGYRIEPGEMEAALCRFPGVSDALVIGQDVTAGKQLVAYIVCGSNPPELAELRKFLRDRLPSYMVPDAFVFLDSFPVLTSGKINRKALPAYIPSPALRNEPPSTQVEQALGWIWSDLLRVEDVGLDDNFFELGGDSILGLHAVAKANELGYDIAYKHIFEYQTIRELAAVASAKKTPPLPIVGDASEVPMTPIQKRFFERELVCRSHFNQARMFVPVQQLEAALVRETLGCLIKDHDAFRFRYRHSAGGIRQYLIHEAHPIPFEMVKIDPSDPSQCGFQLESHASATQASLDLDRGPILRVVLYLYGSKQWLFFVVHHLAVDIVSWRVIVDDFCRIYQQLAAGGATTGKSSVSYVQWACALDALVRSSELETELPYWEAELSLVMPGLPLDLAGDNLAGSTVTVGMELTEYETTRLVRDGVRQHQIPVQHAVLAGAAHALCAWTKAKMFLVDVEGHGRDAAFDLDLSRSVGWFTAVYPLRLDLGATVLESATRIKNKIGNVPRGGQGYGLLRYGSRRPAINERMRRLPMADVSFNYLGQLDSTKSAAKLLKPAKQRLGQTTHERESREYSLDLIAFIANKRLRIDWIFSPNLHRRQTIEALAAMQLDSIRDLITDRKSVV